MTLNGRRILLGVTGGIAAYKAAELTRLLVKAGADVRVVMTEAATAFITPLTFQALSGQPVRTTLFDPAHEAAMGHIELARWPDLILIAPASADFLARLAHGHADDLLTTLCLASATPPAVSPAMNQQMWCNPATQTNIAQLRARAIRIWGPAAGAQACGDHGPGRMLEPDALFDEIAQAFAPPLLAGKRVMITAGPTREAIDPVRYLSNRSSGKMGFALARAAREAGAEVTLIAGPVSLPMLESVTRFDVESGAEMHTCVLDHLPGHDIFIATAAVSDYRPARAQPRKIKKSADAMQLDLIRNPDILADVAAHTARPFCVGFAAETHDLEPYARDKLIRKRLDLIVANQVGDGLGFGTDDNALHAFWNSGEQNFPRADKLTLARQLVALIAERLTQTRAGVTTDASR
ncbi:MAG: bifunctional phosphopantothenoylcysteine decarboxylase/phosphopantothenate--cysteine ligase CoaBC [Thiotrichales bacterium]